MQAKSPRRSNRERTDATRDALTRAARALFVGHGYAQTSTPQVCATAGITRGALYHHFEDKRDLFRHVLELESQAVTDEIMAATSATMGARDALLAGADAYLTAMSVPGRTQLLLVDGPAVLGVADVMAMDEAHAAGTLREGLAAALPPGAVVPADALARLLSAAFDRAALDLDSGAEPEEVRAAMRWLLERTLAP
jgi:AcrR family transcriptional regulator